MEFKFFDTSEIFAKAEREDLYDMGDNLLNYENSGFSHRWIQPPVACYFMSTIDEYGNANLAPVSMGSAVWGEPPNANWFFAIAVQNSRDSQKNLLKTGECVISYYTYPLIRQSIMSSMPIPHGISEIDVCRLTALPSKKVKPCGIAECVSNLECRLLHHYQVANTTIFILEVIGASVLVKAIEEDQEHPYQPGLVMTDLLYEVSITSTDGNPRMNFTRMNLEKIERAGDEFGDPRHWIGNFQTWMEGEVERGKQTATECDEMIKLNQLWLNNPNPITNADVKEELTTRLSSLLFD
ncbi:MAG: flavin reductase family protein [Saccharofermentanales bacterium]|jgi:flavin reductase (DIM6/NTAB) family NADH-FMN oxidoreductase RutF